MRSEIFESFVKIAKEKGLVDDYEDSDTNRYTEKNLDNPRWDSLSIEQIGKLYNVKLEAPEGQTYVHNIMELAHPDSTILFQSHDKLNSLIENENQRQNISINITKKQPNGQITQHKYAQSQLILSLVRLANDLDNRNKSELCKLADHCLKQASKPIKKQALIPFAVYPIALALGALYAKQHLALHSDGFALDYEKATSEIDDLLNSSTHWGIEGYTYTPEFLSIASELKTKLKTVNAEIQKLNPLLDKLQHPKDPAELKVIAQAPESKEASQALQELQAVLESVLPFIHQAVVDFQNPEFKKRSIAEKGALSSLVDSTGILHGGWGLISDDFDDASRAIATLFGDLKSIAKILVAGEEVKQTSAQVLAQAKDEASKITGNKPTAEPQEDPEALASEMEGHVG